MATPKKRIDLLLVERGLVSSRELAQSIIMRGDVLISDRPVDKPGAQVPLDADIRIRGEIARFVGRGGEKIDPLFESFSIRLENRVAIDIGASTGGFTDAMLQRGAAKVYAVDVGYNQLAEKLRRDSRVVSMEKTHAKELEPAQFVPPPDFCVMDVSFIGVRKILDAVIAVLAPPREMLVLVKPQFELGPECVDKGGVVKDPALRLEAVRLVTEAFAVRGATDVASLPAALPGAKMGNQEYFVYGRFPSS
ncbi:MAG: TlyA family RNA methyltransferase [Deltaproteobacteria bacterium]|nr:TlyA family RNA methyltransferase [Deltaproteobacteria bacterium]